MDARDRLIIIKGKDRTDSVSSFQFHDGKCEVIYTSAPNKTYSFQRSNVEILPLQKKINPTEVIVTANGKTINGIDELLDFGGYYRIVRKKNSILEKCAVPLLRLRTDGSGEKEKIRAALTRYCHSNI